MSARALEAKHEKILKELVRRPENKRCADCDTTGPSYAVTNFNTFVCTVCGGVHRQFGHRVKGITMATFKPEEIAALQAGGNQVKDLAKPLDRTPQKIKDWIEAVYVKKRYFSEDAPPVKAAVNGTAPQPKRPTIEVPKAPAPAAATSVTSPTGPTAAAAAAAPFDPFGDATPTSTTNSTPNEPAWADFGAPTPAAAPAAPAPTPAAGAPQGWAAFGDAPSQTASQPAPTSAAAPAAGAGWQAFGANGTAEANGTAAAPVAAPEPVKPPAPKELPLELFSEVQSLGIPGYAPPQSAYGAPGAYPPRPPAFAATVHATAGYGAPPPPTINAPYQGAYPSAAAPQGYPQYAAPAPSPAAGYAPQGFAAAQPQHYPQQQQQQHYPQYAAPSPAGPAPDSFADLGQSFRSALPTTTTGGAVGGNPFA